MKNKVLKAAFSAAMIAGAGIGSAELFWADKAEAAYTYQSVSSLEEYATVADVIGYEPDGRIVEDNPYKRITTYSNKQGQTQYKSVFFKQQNTVKVMNLRGGQLYYGQLKTVQEDATTQPAGDTISQYPETAKIESIINTDGLTSDVVEDNYGKRIILFKDANGQVEYKSIFIKHTNMLKVIDLDGGQIYYGSI